MKTKVSMCDVCVCVRGNERKNTDHSVRKEDITVVSKMIDRNNRHSKQTF